MSKLKKQGTALITGASTGIGAVYADRLARRGYDLILVARNHERLEELATREKVATDCSVKVLVADLATREGLAQVEQELKRNQSISLLVNNAGVGATGPLLSSDIEKMEQMITLNVTALTRLTYAAVPGLVQRGQGTLINIASIVALAPELLNGVYGGTKAFVLALSQSLHHELTDKGIKVQAVLPGVTATEFWDTAGTPVSNLPSDWVMSAEDMVDAALAGLDQGELVTIPSLPNLADWAALENAREQLRTGLSRTKPAVRYGVS
jgi:short-subunit dehydrogenase